MKARLLIASVATVGALVACSDKTPVYPGQATPGAPVTMTLNKTSFTMPDGGTATLAAQLLDSAGNVATGTIAFASCNTAVVTTKDSATSPAQWAGATTLTAVGVSAVTAATLVGTPSCVTATSGTIVDTALVTVGPASLSITGPLTISSGFGSTVSPFVSNPATLAASINASGLPPQVYKVTGFNHAGVALPANSFFHQWGTVDSLLLRPWSRSADSVTATQPGHLGNTRIVVTAVGGATAVLNVAVVPDTFTKTGATLTALGTDLPLVDSVRATRCSAVAGACTGINPAYGSAANARVFVDGVETFITSTTGNNQFILMPPILPAHASTTVPVLIGGMATAAGTTPFNGATAIWQFGTLAVLATAGTNTEPADATNDVAATGFLTSKGAASTTNLYGALHGASCVDATVAGAAGTDCLDWFAFTNSDAVNAHPLIINLLWLTDADLDLTVFDNTGAGAPLSPNGSTRAVGAFNAAGESVSLTIPANTTIRIRVRFHAAGSAAATVYRLQYVMS